jgi:hypothetical protein
VIDRAREHARELGLTEPRLDGRDLRFGIANRRFVVFRRAELEVLGRVAKVLFELLNGLELALGVRPLS